MPIALDEKMLALYKDLKNSGYDLFNINDSFYNDICSPYKSDNGTDVLLSDRKNDIYNNIPTTCQSNCEYSSFDLEHQLLKCDCHAFDDEIDFHDSNKFYSTVFCKMTNKNFTYLTYTQKFHILNYIQLSNKGGSFIQ